MKRAILIFMIFLPVGAKAQEVASSLQKDPRSAVPSGQMEAVLAKSRRDVLLGLNRNSVSGFASGLAAEAPQKQRRETARTSAAGSKVSRPKTEGSMVGYIDNAIIGSQTRIRFDAAVHDDTPDLAGFFYGKCGCYKLLNTVPVPSLMQAYDPNASGPGPGVPGWVDFQQLYLNGEYALNSRFSVFTEVPFRWIQPQAFLAIPPFPPFKNQGGIGDARAGLKLGLHASTNHYLTFQFRTFFPSGNPSKGMSTNHSSLETALLYYQKLSSRAAIESQLGGWYPIGGDAGVPVSASSKFSGKVFFYGFGPSYTLYNSGRVRFAPVVEVVGWRVLGGFVTQPGGPVLGASANASGTNIVNIKFGARTAFGPHNSIYLGYGRALTNADWYKEIFRAEYRFSF